MFEAMRGECMILLLSLYGPWVGLHGRVAELVEAGGGAEAGEQHQVCCLGLCASLPPQPLPHGVPWWKFT
jgi:hypothetical protein